MELPDVAEHVMHDDLWLAHQVVDAERENETRKRTLLMEDILTRACKDRGLPDGDVEKTVHGNLLAMSSLELAGLLENIKRGQSVVFGQIVCQLYPGVQLVSDRAA